VTAHAQCLAAGLPVGAPDPHGYGRLESRARGSTEAEAQQALPVLASLHHGGTPAWLDVEGGRGPLADFIAAPVAIEGRSLHIQRLLKVRVGEEERAQR
jgi:hypothetical protein